MELNNTIIIGIWCAQNWFENELENPMQSEKQLVRLELFGFRSTNKLD